MNRSVIQYMEEAIKLGGVYHEPKPLVDLKVNPALKVDKSTKTPPIQSSAGNTSKVE